MAYFTVEKEYTSNLRQAKNNEQVTIRQKKTEEKYKRNR